MATARWSKDWKRRESLGSALLQLALVAAVLGLGVYLVYRRGTARKELAQVMREARTTAQRGNREDLRAALGVVDRALKLDASAADPNAFAAALWTDLWLDHHEPDARDKAVESLEKAERAGARSADRYGVEAQHRLAAGDPAAVVSFVEDLRQQGGSGARLFLAEAQALRAQGRLSEARASLLAAMDKDYRDGRLACALGEALLEDGTPGAIDTFGRVALEHPDLVRARLGLALARLLKGEKLAQVEAELTELLARERELSSVERARAEAINAGLLEAQGHYDEALTQAQSALLIEPKEVWAMLFRARALAATGDARAAEAFSALIDAAPAAPLFYFEGAARLQRARQPDAATSLLDRYEAFFAAVKRPGADGGRELSFLERDDRYWLTRGDLLKSAGHLEQASTAYERAIDAKASNLARAVYAKASLLVARGEPALAQALLANITPPDGTGPPEAYLAMGELLFQKKEWGAGCQSFAFGLTALKAAHAPSTRLTEVLLDVERRLKAGGQRDLAKLWMDEAKPMAQ